MLISNSEYGIELYLDEDTFATGTPKFKFEKVYVSKKSPYPLVRVTYRILVPQLPVPEVGGLALDIGKRVFIDHFEDEEMESAAQRLALKIADYAGDYIMNLIEESATNPSIP